MKNCPAFSAQLGSRSAWKPCARPAIPGSQFCAQHTEAAAGIMLGICVQDLLQPTPPAAQESSPAPRVRPGLSRPPEQRDAQLPYGTPKHSGKSAPRTTRAPKAFAKRRNRK
jgi:hypothetical protein